MKQKVFDALRQKIAADTGIELNNIHRLYPGAHQRAAGAWSWVATDISGANDFGSLYSARQLLKSPC